MSSYICRDTIEANIINVLIRLNDESKDKTITPL